MSDHAGGDGYEVGPPQWRHEVAAVPEGGGEVSSPSPMDWCWWGSMRLACKYSKLKTERRSPPSAFTNLSFFFVLPSFLKQLGHLMCFLIESWPGPRPPVPELNT